MISRTVVSNHTIKIKCLWTIIYVSDTFDCDYDYRVSFMCNIGKQPKNFAAEVFQDGEKRIANTFYWVICVPHFCNKVIFEVKLLYVTQMFRNFSRSIISCILLCLARAKRPIYFAVYITNSKECTVSRRCFPCTIDGA